MSIRLSNKSGLYKNGKSWSRETWLKVKSCPKIWTCWKLYINALWGHKLTYICICAHKCGLYICFSPIWACYQVFSSIHGVCIFAATAVPSHSCGLLVCIVIALSTNAAVAASLWLTKNEVFKSNLFQQIRSLRPAHRRSRSQTVLLLAQLMMVMRQSRFLLPWHQPILQLYHNAILAVRIRSHAWISMPQIKTARCWTKSQSDAVLNWTWRPCATKPYDCPTSIRDVGVYLH